MILKLILAGIFLLLAFYLLAGLRFMIQDSYKLIKNLHSRSPKLRIKRRKNKDANWNNVIIPQDTKEELQIIQSILRNPKSYQKQWGQTPPKGMILHGPPGTGKTLIAKKLAQDAGYHFLNISTADVKDKHLGESEQRIKELYKRARDKAPCIIFLDEIDSIGSKRSGVSSDAGGAGRAQNSLTNQLLQEIDGMHSNQTIFTIGATNHLRLIDDALLSRLSYQIYVGLPDARARRELFNLFTNPYKKRLNYSIDELVQTSQGMSGREIETVCKIAAMIAHGNNGIDVGEREFERAFKRLGNNRGNYLNNQTLFNG